MELKQRTMLITGGASGIGYALAKQFIARRNKVIICGRSQERLDKARKAVPELETFRCDINSAKDLNALVSFIASKYPGLDTLINNAGIQQQLELTSDNVSDQQIFREINTNFTAHISVTMRLYDLLCSNRNATIIFTGSALGLVAKHDVPIYSAAKAGIHSFVQSLRQQVKPYSVRVVEIFPDLVETLMTQHRQSESMMSAEEFASTVLEQLAQDKEDIYIGKVRMLSLLNRLSPGLASKAMNMSYSV